jgi:hypothetical protein
VIAVAAQPLLEELDELELLDDEDEELEELLLDEDEELLDDEVEPPLSVGGVPL